jgi:hypothetical protein
MHATLLWSLPGSLIEQVDAARFAKKTKCLACYAPPLLNTIPCTFPCWCVALPPQVPPEVGLLTTLHALALHGNPQVGNQPLLLDVANKKKHATKYEVYVQCAAFGVATAALPSA